MDSSNVSRLYEDQDVRIKVISDRPWSRAFGNIFQKIEVVTFEGKEFFAVRAFAKFEDGKFLLQKGQTRTCPL